jgi:hypothetical protein
MPDHQDGTGDQAAQADHQLYQLIVRQHPQPPGGASSTRAAAMISGATHAASGVTSSTSAVLVVCR